MTLHPLLLAILVADLMAAALALAAAKTALRVVLGWAPGAPSRDQLALERQVEAASLQGRGATWLTATGSLLFVGAIAGVLPALVPGAMCGTGVVEATGGLGGRALALRGLAVAALAAWHLLDRLDRGAPGGPLSPAAARAWLLATPLTLLATWDTFRAIGALDAESPVSCCAAVYEAAAVAAAGGDGGGSMPELFAAGGGALVLLGLALALSRRLAGGRLVPTLTALGAVAWAPIAALYTIEELTAYHYQVLHHECPWCLLSSDHGAVGYLIFGALLLAVLEAIAAGLAAATGARVPEVAAAATSRARRAGLIVALATLVFLAAAAAPALAWRLEHGVWIR
ncbi:MAG: hypothetical protein CSA66_04925 [Proteobacteria bacterium]|nr:MAG: hypothetical protein CSA66_04925 [Pseudomonadota bacterium]